MNNLFETTTATRPFENVASLLLVLFSASPLAVLAAAVL
jgi:hypothetical protein